MKIYENVEGESILNVTQDHMVTTNEIVSDNVEIDVNETVEAGGSKDNGVNIFNQLALMMEMMSGIKTEIKSEINIVNDKLDKQDEKMKT